MVDTWRAWTTARVPRARRANASTTTNTAIQRAAHAAASDAAGSVGAAADPAVTVAARRKTAVVSARTMAARADAKKARNVAWLPAPTVHPTQGQ